MENELPEGFDYIEDEGVPVGYEEIPAGYEEVPDKAASNETIGALPFGLGPRSGQGGVKVAPLQEATQGMRDVAIGGTYEAVRRPLDFLEDADPTGLAKAGRPDELPLGVPYEPQYSEQLTDAAATLGPSVLGGIGGAKVAGAVIGEAKTLLPKALKWLMTTTGASVGYGASNNPEAGNLVVGEGGLFAGLDEKDEEGKRNRLSTFANDVADAMVLAYPSELAAKSVAKATAFVFNTTVKPVYRWISGNVLPDAEQEVVSEFIKLTKMAREAKTPQERQMALEEIAAKMLEHEKIVFKSGDEEKAILRDTVSALEESLKGSTDVPDANTIVSKARSLRTGALQSGGKAGDLPARISDVSDQTDEMLQTAEAMKGGDPAVNTAGEGIQEQAKTKFQKEAQGPDLAKAEELSIAEKDLSTVFAEDPALKSQLDKLNDAVELDVYSIRNNTLDDIAKNTEKAYDEHEKKLGELAKEIPDGIPVDFSEDLDTLLGVEDIVKKFGKQGLIDPETMTGDFKRLYREGVPQLNRLINDKMRAGGDSSALQAFRQLIRDKVETTPGAEQLRDYYRDVWAPVWKDGKLEDFRKAQYLKKSQPVNAAVKQEEAIGSAITGNPRFTEHLNKIEGNEPLVTDWYLQNAAADLQSQINMGKSLSEIKTADIVKPLQQYAANLKKSNPEAYKRVNDFVTKIRDKNIDIGKLKIELDDLAKARDDAERIIFDKEYREFFNLSMPKKGNQYSNFDKLLKNDDSGQVISDVIATAKAEGRDDIVKGVQSAYLRYIKSNIFEGKSKIVPAGGKAFRTSFINDSLDGSKNTLDYGRRIFADEPEAMEFIEAVMKEGKRIQESVGNVTAQAPVDYKKFKSQTGAALSRLITWTFGVLNKRGARATTFKGAAMQEYTSPEEVLESVVDRFYTDPQYAVKLIREFAAAQAKGPKSTELAQSLRNWVVFQLKGSDASIEDVAQIEQDARSVIQGDMDDEEVQRLLEEGTKGESTLEDQTEENFGDGG